jgi:hypothetical protein
MPRALLVIVLHSCEHRIADVGAAQFDSYPLGTIVMKN